MKSIQVVRYDRDKILLPILTFISRHGVVDCEEERSSKYIPPSKKYRQWDACGCLRVKLTRQPSRVLESQGQRKEGEVVKEGENNLNASMYRDIRQTRLNSFVSASKKGLDSWPHHRTYKGKEEIIGRDRRK